MIRYERLSILIDLRDGGEQEAFRYLSAMWNEPENLDYSHVFSELDWLALMVQRLNQMLAALALNTRRGDERAQELSFLFMHVQSVLQNFKVFTVDRYPAIHQFEIADIRFWARLLLEGNMHNSELQSRLENLRDGLQKIID